MRTSRLSLCIVVLTFMLVGCIANMQPQSTEAQNTPRGANVVLADDAAAPIVGPDYIPAIDLSKHSVPLEAYFNQRRFAFPVSEAALDDQLEAGAKVLVVRLGEDVRAYPLSGTSFASEGRLSDAEIIGGEDVVIWRDLGSESGAVYRPTVNGQQLTFNVVDGDFVDDETGSRWDFAGRAIEGELAGVRLEAVSSKTTFWFAAVAAEPEVVVRMP